MSGVEEEPREGDSVGGLSEGSTLGGDESEEMSSEESEGDESEDHPDGEISGDGKSCEEDVSEMDAVYAHARHIEACGVGEELHEDSEEGTLPTRYVVCTMECVVFSVWYMARRIQRMVCR